MEDTKKVVIPYSNEEGEYHVSFNLPKRENISFEISELTGLRGEFITASFVVPLEVPLSVRPKKNESDDVIYCMLTINKSCKLEDDVKKEYRPENVDFFEFPRFQRILDLKHHWCKSFLPKEVHQYLKEAIIEDQKKGRKLKLFLKKKLAKEQTRKKKELFFREGMKKLSFQDIVKKGKPLFLKNNIESRAFRNFVNKMKESTLSVYMKNSNFQEIIKNVMFSRENIKKLGFQDVIVITIDAGTRKKIAPQQILTFSDYRRIYGRYVWGEDQIGNTKILSLLKESLK